MFWQVLFTAGIFGCVLSIAIDVIEIKNLLRELRDTLKGGK